MRSGPGRWAALVRHRNSVIGRLAFASALGALIGGALATLPDLAAHIGVGLRGAAV